MALRLFSARTNIKPQVFADEVTSKDRPFHCFYCGTSVDRVRDHIVKGDDERLRRHVPAFFRLSTGYSHDGHCPCTVDGAVKFLIREADAVEDESEREFEVLDGKVNFRLNIPTVMARRHADIAPGEPFGGKLARIMKEGHLDSYCRSAVGLAKIWNAVDASADRSALSNLVTVADRGKRVLWANFCFSHNRYERLTKELRKEKKHSCAVAVTVREIIDRGEDQDSVVRCYAVRTSKNNDYIRVSPTLLAPSRLARRFIIGKQYIVFGSWRLADIDDYKVPESDRIIRYQSVLVRVQRQAQFAKFEVAGEGDEPSK